jgi:hypothetical protein
MNDSKLNDSKLNDSKLNDSKLNDSKLNDSKLNDSKLNDNDKNSSPNSDSDLDWDSDFESTDKYVTTDTKHVYQVQYISEEKYKLNLVGLFKVVPSIEIYNFDHDGYSCYITSNFFEFNDTHKSGTCLFDMITMDVIKNDGCTFKLKLCVEIENSDPNKENKGNLMIWFQSYTKEVPLKTNLSHPGNEKVPYYLIGELKNEKITELLKN